MTSSSRRAIALSILTTVLPLTDAIRVTPGSPCTALCTDSSDLPTTDPNFYNSTWEDVVCSDGDYNNVPKGQKLKGCLGCLQDSTYMQSNENDQYWFLYNMRYAFSYCWFGYPNATGFESGPCMTKEACGTLAPPLQYGVPDPTNSTQYGYCDVDEGAINGSAYGKCMECIQADRDHFYIANFLVALKAACQKKPAPGSTIPLNATVFSSVTLSLIDPNPSPAPKGMHLPAAAIAGITVGAIIVASLAIGCIFLQIRKRRNRENKQGRSSALSFRCQTDVSQPPPPHTGPAFHPQDYDDDRFFVQEKPTAGPAGVAATMTSPYAAESQHSFHNGASSSAAFRENTAISVITTTLPPPSPAHLSQQVSPDEYMSPASTVSLNSSAPLLSQHHPGTSVSPLSTYSAMFGSPQPNQSGWQSGMNQPDTVWEEEHQQQPEGARREPSKKKSKGRMGTPVESQVLQTSFPPPPKW